MKRVITMAMLVLMIIVLTGCVNGKFHVTVHKDGSGDLLYRLSVAPNLLQTHFGGDTSLDEFTELAEQRGFTISQFKENGQYGIEARKHVDDLSNIGDDIFTNILGGMSNMSLTDRSVLTVDEGFIFDTYTFNLNLNLKNLTLNFPFSGLLLDQVDLKMLVTLPIEANDHNASYTSFNGGNTYEWDILLGEKNEIYLQLKVPNVKNIVFLVIGVVVGIAIIVFVTKRMKRER